ncbi:MAG: sodium:proton exchanger [Gammaproteobacteria bacterium]|nr:sodium:proton exchanger [Gammaproteobacteria bacterium]
MSQELFQQFLLILGFSLVGAVLLQRLRMATIVAYIIVGALIGPAALGLIDDPSQFSLLAEFGVVLLLFTLGLEFNFKKMLAMRFAVFGVGSMQVAVCTGVFAIAVYMWGASLPAAIIIAGTLALSSTAIVTRELLNNRQTHSQHGQLSIGVLLFQDLIAVVFLVLVPVFGQQTEVSLLANLTQAGINAAILLLLLLAAGKWLLPIIYAEVARSKSEEIFALTTLVIVLLAAWLTHSFQLSMALGGFVTGMMLGEGSFHYQIQSDIRAFRDILLGLFFVTIGMSIDLTLLFNYWPRIILFTIGLIAIKTLVVALSVRLLSYGARDAFRVGLNLAQAGEFGIALMALALVNQIVPSEQASFVTIIAILTMVASPFLIRHTETISRWLTGGDASLSAHQPGQVDLNNHVIIGGYGRLGTTLAGFLEGNAIAYIAIDTDINVVEKYRKLGKNIVYGDSHSAEILGYCNLSSARLVVLTFKSMEQGKAAIASIRPRAPDVAIIVRCLEEDGFDELISLGANLVFPELLESSLMISRQALEILHVSVEDIDVQMRKYRNVD